MITSAHNDKLKLIRRLARRRGRESEGLFVAEGEDLIASAREAGHEPVELLTAPGSGLGGEEAEQELLDRVSGLGSGTRAIGVFEVRWADPGALRSAQGPCAYLHGVSDPGNVGAIIRTVSALAGGAIVLGPDCADPYGPKSVRAAMGATFTAQLVRADAAATPTPRLALVAHGGDWPPEPGGAATVCLGAERAGLPGDVIEACEHAATVPLRAGSESLNVAAAAAIAFERISSRGGEGGP